MTGSDTQLDRTAPRRTHWRIGRYLWVVAVAIYAVVVWYVGWRNVRDAAASMALGWFTGMLGCELAAMWVRALKWRYVLGSGVHAFGVFFLSKTAGQYSPGRLGELSPLLLREHRNARTGAWIVVDRLLETASTLAFGLTGLLALQLAVRGTLLWVVGAFLLLLAAPLAVITRRSLFEWLADRTRTGSAANRGALFLAAVSDAVKALGRKVPLAAAMTVAGTLLELAGAVMLYRAFGYRVTLLMTAAAKCANSLVAAIPLTPGVTGVPQVATGYVMHEAAGIPADVLATALGLHLVVATAILWSSFGVGLLDLRRPRAGAPAKGEMPDGQ